MFTPHGKGWTGLSTPAPVNQRSSGAAAAASPMVGQGRAVAKRLIDREKELHEYQHSMGLLLIENKERAAKNDQINQTLAENEEILKREQASHLNAIREYEKRKDSIQKALAVEKQRIADLVRAVSELRSEVAEVKLTSQKKMAGAQSFEARMDEKSLVIDRMLHAADAKLAEANLEMSRADKKFKENEARLHRFEREKLYYETEFKLHEKQLKEKEESTHDWEKRLKESQNRVTDLQRSLNDREGKVNANYKILKMKHEELQNTKWVLEGTNADLKIKEDDINKRLHELHGHEKEIEIKHKALDKKEKQLADWEDKIIMKENLGRQKMLEDHKAELETKRQDFESLLRRERESFCEEMHKRVADLEHRENDVKSKEGNLLKTEQKLNWDTQNLDDWKNDLDLWSQAIKGSEESLKTDEEKVAENKQQIERERKDVDLYRLHLESTKAAAEAEKQSILKKQEIVDLAIEEREENSRLVVQQKQEIERCQGQSISLSEEANDLRQQKLKLEKAWGEVDKERSHTKEGTEKLNNERTRLQMWHHSEKRRLEDMELEVGEKYQKQLTVIRAKEDVLMGDIEHQKLQINQLMERELADIKSNLQLHRHKLETDMERKQANEDHELEEKKNELNKRLDIVENEISSAVELNQFNIQKILFEKKELEKGWKALVMDRQNLETDKADIKKDIDSLDTLRKSLMERREAIKKENNQLIGLIDKYKVCKTCGVSVFDGLNVVRLQDMVDTRKVVEEGDRSLSIEALPQGTDRLVNSGGSFPILQKCSGLFRSSPSRKAECSLGQQVSSDQKDSGATTAGEKRIFARLSGSTTTEQGLKDGEIYSERRKRQHIGPAMPLPGQNRFSLGLHRVSVIAAISAQTRSGKMRAVKAGSEEKSRASSGCDAEGMFSCEDRAAQRDRASGLHISTGQTKVQVSHVTVGTGNKDDGHGSAGKACVSSSPSDSELEAEDDESPRENKSIGSRLWTFLIT